MSMLTSLLLLAAGQVFTWNGPDGASWQSEGSYVESGKPGAGDTVTIPRDMNPVVTDADFDYVSNLALIELQVKCSVTFDVTGTRTLGCAVRQKASEISSYSREVSLVKRGGGKLILAAPSDGITPYMAGLDVEEGTLGFAEDYRSATLACVSLNVAADARVDLCGVSQLNVGQLFGSGTIENAYGNGCSLIYIARERQSSDYAGTIVGNIALRASYGGSRLTLTGVESDFHTFYTHGTGTVEIAKFGRTGEPSSIGTNGCFEAKANGARFVYLGTGETTDKSLKFDNSQEALTMDGGAHGGITFEGAWGLDSGSRYMRRLALDGSNTEHECVFAGPYRDYGTSDYATYITKKGTGIWRLADNAERQNHGVIAVENGTLRFDSIAEAGEICSLGLSSSLYADCYGKLEATNAVPYALLLGGETTEGTLEYTGGTDASCTSRLVAVKGMARLRNATEHGLRLKGVVGVGDGDKTLTLDGDSAAAVNRLEDVTNVVGSLSIAKEGNGTWTLGGNLRLNGGTIDVREGTLIIERKAIVPTWYRFTVKQCMMYSLVDRGIITSNDRSRSYDKTLFLNELAFYDADGIRRNSGIERAEDGTAVPDMLAGTLVQTQGETVNSRWATRLFDGTGSGDGWHAINTTYSSYMTPETPETWIQIAFRPAAADLGKIISAFDFANTYTQDSPIKYQRWYQPDIFTIEGSANGQDWTVLTNVLSSAENRTAGHWNSDDTEVSNADRPGKGFPVDGRLHDAVAFDGVSSVSVASGATLKADAADGERFAIGGLTLDPAAGAGTIEGFDFAEDGVIDVNAFSGSSSDCKFTLIDVNGFGNVRNWSFTLNGQQTERYVVAVSPAGRVTVSRKGLMVIVK